METLIGHFATGAASVLGMAVFQKIILNMQDRKLEKACADMKEKLGLKQDSYACGLMNQVVTDGLSDIKIALADISKKQNAMVTDVAVLKNNRKHQEEKGG